MYLALWLISRWRLPATPCFTLPVAVSVKRFLTPLLVLSLGIFVSFVPRSDFLGGRRYRTATAALTGRAVLFSNCFGSAGVYWRASTKARRRVAMDQSNQGPA